MIVRIGGVGLIGLIWSVLCWSACAGDGVGIEIGSGMTLEAGSTTLELSGSWENRGAFAAGAGTVRLTGTAQSLAGSTVFNVLESRTPGAALTFAAGDSFLVQCLALTGADQSLLSLRSSVPGTDWYLTVPAAGSYEIHHVDVQDSNASGGQLLDPDEASVDSGNNTNWGFNAPPFVSDAQPGYDYVIMVVGETRSFSVDVYDEDPLSYSWTMNGIPLVGETTSIYTYSPTTQDIGQHTLVVSISDGMNPPVTHEWHITVLSSNRPPYVDAGADQMLTSSTGASTYLDGWALDDGLPSPPAGLTLGWSVVEGSGTVTFANPADPQTEVTLPQPGRYVLRLSASDGEYVRHDEVEILVCHIDAGPGLNVTSLPATLNGTAAPVGFFQTHWNQLSGPGEMLTVDMSSLVTDALFTKNGQYLIRLTGMHGSFTARDEAWVTVSVPEAVDNVAPVISSPNPEVSSTVDDGWPVIWAEYADEVGGSGIDLSSVRIEVDGVDVTDEAYVGDSFVMYWPEEKMSPGTHNVTVSVADRKQNQASYPWSFEIDLPGAVENLVGRPGYQKAVLTWEEPLDDVAIMGYRIYRDGTVLTNLGASTFLHIDRYLTNDQQYAYSVVVLVDDGQGGTTEGEAADVNVTPNQLQVTLTYPNAPVVTGECVTLKGNWSIEETTYGQPYYQGGPLEIQAVANDSNANITAFGTVRKEVSLTPPTDQRASDRTQQAYLMDQGHSATAVRLEDVPNAVEHAGANVPIGLACSFVDAVVWHDQYYSHYAESSNSLRVRLRLFSHEVYIPETSYYGSFAGVALEAPLYGEISETTIAYDSDASFDFEFLYTSSKGNGLVASESGYNPTEVGHGVASLMLQYTCTDGSPYVVNYEVDVYPAHGALLSVGSQSSFDVRVDRIVSSGYFFEGEPAVIKSGAGVDSVGMQFRYDHWGSFDPERNLFVEEGFAYFSGLSWSPDHPVYDAPDPEEWDGPGGKGAIRIDTSGNSTQDEPIEVDFSCQVRGYDFETGQPLPSGPTLHATAIISFRPWVNLGTDRPDAEEAESPGMCVDLNADDDDADTTADNLDAVVNGAGDLADMKTLGLGAAPWGVEEGQLVIRKIDGSGKVRIFQVSGGDWANATVALGPDATESVDLWTHSSLYVEGVEEGEVRLEAAYIHPTHGDIYTRDEVVLTVRTNELLCDRNHDGEITHEDSPGKDEPGALMLAGYGLEYHPALAGKTTLLLPDIPAATNTLAQLRFATPHVRVWNGETELTVDRDPSEGFWYVQWRPYYDKYTNFDVRCMRDAKVGFDLYVGTSGSMTWTDGLTITWLSAGVGAPDALAPVATVVPGHAAVNLASGNLHFSDRIRSYNTPAMGPTLSLFYNHLDALPSRLPTGWRTNFDMRITDFAFDRDEDEDVDNSDREEGDLLALVDETGNRFGFRWDPAKQKYVSLSECGLSLATVEPELAESFGSGDAAGEVEDGYKLVRNDGQVLIFSGTGTLVRVQTVRNKGLTISGEIVTDDCGRTEDISRFSFDGLEEEIPPELRRVCGREGGDWKFVYEDIDHDGIGDRLGGILLSGGFVFEGDADRTHVEYGVRYDDEDRVDTVLMPYREAPAPGVLESEENLTAWLLRDSDTARYPAQVITYDEAEVSMEDTFGFTTEYELQEISVDGEVSVYPAWVTRRNAEEESTTRSINTANRRLGSESVGSLNAVFDYDDFGRLTMRQVLQGTTATFAYYAHGEASFVEGCSLLRSSRESAGLAPTTYTYFTDASKAGLLKDLIDPCGGKTSFEYDANGYLVLRKVPKPNSLNNDQVAWTIAPDVYGNPITTTSPLQRVTSTNYDAQGRLQDEDGPMQPTEQTGNVDPDERTYSYDARGRQTRLSSSGGVTTSTTYDPFGRPVSHTDANGLTSSSAFDPLGRITRTSQPGLHDTTYTYTVDAAGIVTEVMRGSRLLSRERQDRVGRTTSSTTPRILVDGAAPVDCTVDYEYTAEGLLDLTRDENSKVTDYSYDAAGRRTGVSTPEGVNSVTAYDDDGRVESTTQGLVTTTYDYDDCGRRTHVTNALGGTTVTTYDKAGNVISVDPPGAGPETYQYDEDGAQASRTDVFGNVWKTEIDFSQNSVKTGLQSGTGFDPDRWVKQECRDPRGFMNAQVTPQTLAVSTMRNDGVWRETIATGPGEGKDYRYGQAFDSAGRKIEDYTFHGENKFASISAYDENGDLAAIVTPSGNRIEPDVRETGEVMGVKDLLHGGASLATIGEKTAAGFITKTVDAAGETWIRTPEPNGRRLASMTAPDGVVSSITYKAQSDFVQSIGTGNRTVSYEYNAAGLQTEARVGSAIVSVRAYDEAGRVVSETVGTAVTTYYYNETTGLLETVTAPGNRVTSFGYDNFGNRTRITDPMLRITEYDYDKRNRLELVTYPDNTTESYTYYDDDSVHTMTDRAGRTTTFEYQKGGRLAKKTLHDGSVITYGYDGAGNVVEEVYNGKRVTRRYDARNRLTRIESEGRTVDFSHRADDRISDKQIPEESHSALHYTYDAAGRLETVSNAATGTTAVYSYYTSGPYAGLPQSLTLPGGVVRQFSAYDVGGRIKQMQQTANGVLQALWSYTYDDAEAGRLESVEGADGEGPFEVAFAYDAAGRLTSETRTGIVAWTKTYGYDACDNRTSMTVTESGVTTNFVYHYDNCNRLTSIDRDGVANWATYDYDSAGHLVYKLEDGVVTRFGYDLLGRQTWAGPTAQSPAVEYAYYGPTWMRKSATCGTRYTEYVHDGFACVKQSTAGVDTYYYAPGQQPLWQATAEQGTTTGRHTYVTDGRNNVVGLWNADALGYDARYSFDAFGQRKTVGSDVVSSLHASSIGYRGQLHDAATGDIYLRNRNYSPSLGRFTSPDPIGYEGGLNLYNYCGSDPVNSWDPMGLDYVFVSGGKVFYQCELKGTLWNADFGSPIEIGTALDETCMRTSKRFGSALVQLPTLKYVAWQRTLNDSSSFGAKWKTTNQALESIFISKQLPMVEWTPGLDAAEGAAKVCWEPAALLKNTIEGVGGMISGLYHRHSFYAHALSSGDLQDQHDSMLFGYAASRLDAGDARAVAGVKVGGTVIARGNPVTGIPLALNDVHAGYSEADFRRVGGGAIALPMYAVQTAGIRGIRGTPTFEAIGKMGMKSFLKQQMSMPTFEYLAKFSFGRQGTVLSGHGQWVPEYGNTIMPEGTSLRVYSRMGQGISTELGNAIDAGHLWKASSVRTYGPGQSTPNLSLYNMSKGYIASLSSVLDPNMGTVHWSACTTVEGAPPVGSTQPVIHLPLVTLPVTGN